MRGTAAGSPHASRFCLPGVEAPSPVARLRFSCQRSSSDQRSSAPISGKMLALCFSPCLRVSGVGFGFPMTAMSRDVGDDRGPRQTRFSSAGVGCRRLAGFASHPLPPPLFIPLHPKVIPPLSRLDPTPIPGFSTSHPIPRVLVCPSAKAQRPKGVCNPSANRLRA